MDGSDSIVISIDDKINLKRKDNSIKQIHYAINEKNINEYENTAKQQIRSTDTVEIVKNTLKNTNLDLENYDETKILQKVFKILKDTNDIQNIQQNNDNHSHNHEETTNNNNNYNNKESCIDENDDKITVDPEVIRLLERSQNLFGYDYDDEDERDNNHLELPTISEIVDTSDSDALLNEITEMAQNLKLDDINIFSVLHSVAPLEHILDEEEMTTLWP